MERKQTIRAVGRPKAIPVLLSSNGNHRNGYPFLSHGAAAFSSVAWQEIRRGLKLSARELQIVQGIFDDKLEFTIAAEQGVSINTVRTELRRPGELGAVCRGGIPPTDRLRRDLAAIHLP